jgi:hypothetical protein
MRALVRPLVLFTLLATFTAVVQSQDQGGVGAGLGGPGANIFLFAAGSPSPTTGGVNVGMTVQPTTGYTCTSITIAIVDQEGNTLATATIKNPGATVDQAFTGLGSGVNVDVVVNSVFQSGAQFDYPYLEANVTTK